MNKDNKKHQLMVGTPIDVEYLAGVIYRDILEDYKHSDIYLTLKYEVDETILSSLLRVIQDIHHENYQ